MKKIFFIITIIFFPSAVTFAQIPTDNLKGWYIADSAILSTGYVTQLLDYSGNNNHITQGTLANMPLKVDSSINNHASIKFDANNDFMNFTTSILPTDGKFSYFFVCKNTKTGLNSTMFSQYSAGQAGRTLIVFNFQATNRCTHVTLPDGSALFNFSSSEFFILSCTNNGATSGLKLFENGLQKVQGTATAIQSINSQLGGQQFANYFGGEIAEILIYDSPLDNLSQDSVELYLMNKYSATLYLGDDINVDDRFCDTALVIDVSFTDIQWSTGETNDTIYVNQTGQYWVQATDIFGRLRYDTISVQFPNPNIQNTSICLGDSVLYEPELVGSYDYLWSDAGTEPSKYYKDAGDYWLRIEDSFGCFDTVFFSVAVDSFKNKILLGNDTSLCSGNTISLIEGAELCSSFLWTANGNTNPIQTVNESGWQKIVVENINGCAASDSIYVTIVGSAPTPGYIVENICFGETTQFIDNSTPQADIASWKWIINGNDTLFTQNAEWVFENVGTQNIELFVEAFSGCENSISFEIEILPSPIVTFTNIPGCTGIELQFIPEYSIPNDTELISFSWFVDNVFQSNSEIFAFTFPTSNNYNILCLVELDNGCYGSFNKDITVLNSYDQPSAVSLISPTNNIISSTTHIDFMWNNSSDATFYKIQLALENTFSELLYESENIFSLNYNYTFTAIYDTIYWRVLSFNPCAESSSSEVFLLSLFTPESLPKLKTWLSADFGVNASANSVEQWVDRSSNGNDLIQNIATNKPVIVDYSINGLPTITFDGINDFMNFQTNILPLDAVFSYFFVCKNTQTTNNSTIFSQYIAGQNGRTLLAFNFQNQGNLTHFINPGTNAAQSILTTSFSQISATNTGLSNGLKLFVNNLPAAVGSATAILNTNSQIGGQQFSSYFKGDIAEIIFYDTVLSDSDRQMVERYLHDKYFPPVNLGYDIRVPYGFCDTAITTAYKPWFTNYAWSTGETDSIIHVNRPGVYSVTVTDIFGFESSDDIWVFYPDIIDFSDTILCLGDTLKYEYPRDLPYAFLWSNGDTSRYFESSEAGIHSLTVTDNLGCSYQTYFHLQLHSLSAKMSLGDDRSMCSGEELSPSFGDLPTQDLSYLWMNGSTESSLILQNTHEFSLQVSNERGCVAYDTVQITLQGIKPIAAFDAVGVCFGNETPFTDASSSPDGSNIIAWEWDFGDSLFANAQNPSHTYLESGIYRVKLSILTENLCAAETQLQIAVYSLPDARFSPLTACAQAPLSFIDQSISEFQMDHWSWSFNDSNSTTQNSNLQNPIHIFDSAGTYHVELIVSHVFGCSDTLTQAIEIRPGAMADFNANTACEGSPTWFNSSTVADSWNPVVSYRWESLPLFRDSLPVSSFLFDTAGTYTVTHSIKLLNGCQSEITKNVKVAPNPNALFENSESCLNTPYYISDQSSISSDSIVSVRWFINNQFYAASNPIEINFPYADTFQIKQIVTSNENCSDTLILPVIIHPIPNANFSLEYDPESIGNRIVFSNSSTEAQSYYWDFGNGSVSTQYSPTMDFPLEGSYTISLVATNEHSCSDTTSKTISIANPSMDLHLMEADFVHQDNYVSTNIRFANLGNRPVFSLWIDSKINDKTGREKWIGILRPGEIVDYTLHSTTYLPSYKAIDYACISISNDDYPIERNYENNSICISKSEEFALYELFPNPAQDKITLMLNAPSKNQSEIHIYHPDGRNAQNPIQESLKKGINQIQLPIQNLEAGIYLVQIRFEEKMISRKFVVLR